MTQAVNTDKLFQGRHFRGEVIVLCVRWHLRFKLSYRDLVEMMVERGLSTAHTTIMRWVRCYAPQFERRWTRFAAPVGRFWRADETYVKVHGQWSYLYRAVDRDGRTVDFRLSPRRGVAAAKAFFRKAIGRQPHPPRTIRRTATRRHTAQCASSRPVWFAARSHETAPLSRHLAGRAFERGERRSALTGADG